MDTVIYRIDDAGLIKALDDYRAKNSKSESGKIPSKISRALGFENKDAAIHIHQPVKGLPVYCAYNVWPTVFTIPPFEHSYFVEYVPGYDGKNFEPQSAKKLSKDDFDKLENPLYWRSGEKIKKIVSRTYSSTACPTDFNTQQHKITVEDGDLDGLNSNLLPSSDSHLYMNKNTRCYVAFGKSAKALKRINDIDELCAKTTRALWHDVRKAMHLTTEEAAGRLSLDGADKTKNTINIYLRNGLQIKTCEAFTVAAMKPNPEDEIVNRSRYIITLKNTPKAQPLRAKIEQIGSLHEQRAKEKNTDELRPLFKAKSIEVNSLDLNPNDIHLILDRRLKPVAPPNCALISPELACILMESESNTAILTLMPPAVALEYSIIQKSLEPQVPI